MKNNDNLLKAIVLYAGSVYSFEEVKAEVNRVKDINTTTSNSEGLTYLISAVKYFQADVVSLLLEKGADPNIGDNSGVRPLAYAITKRYPQKPKIIELLLEYGANPALRSRGGQSIIEVAEVCQDFELADRFREIAKKFEEQ